MLNRVVAHPKELDRAVAAFEKLVRIERQRVRFVLARKLLDLWRRKLVVALEPRVPAFECCSNAKTARSSPGDDHTMVLQLVGAPGITGFRQVVPRQSDNCLVLDRRNYRRPVLGFVQLGMDAPHRSGDWQNEPLPAPSGSVITGLGHSWSSCLCT